MDLSTLVLFFIKAMQRNPTLVSQHNKGFKNYVFLRNWVVRNPAGTRLDSSLVNKQVALELVGNILG